MERLITEEQFEKVRIHMRDTYDVAEHEWDEEELIEAIYELIAKNNDVLDLVSDFEIDNLLSDLDKDATDYNGYEYGLPICGEWLVTLRTTVRTWLNK